MTTADGRHSVTYNGELYNHRQLRRELEACGHRFHSRSDTEVFLAAFAEWGTASFARMQGMFAAAILDRRDRRVVLVRDPFGIKPLFYGTSSDHVAFASEIAALRCLHTVGGQVNAARLRDYLSRGHAHHRRETLFADVMQVPPGHAIVVGMDDLRASKPEPYASFADVAPDDSATSVAAAAEALRAIVVSSVAAHLQSDVPLGFSLSGGTDSSAVLVAARRAVGAGEPLEAFGYVPGDDQLSEERYQLAAAEAAGARFHRVAFDSAALADGFDRVVTQQGEPFGSPAVNAQRAVLERARDAGVTVMLGGHGADELFAGYNECFPPRAASLLREGSALGAARFVRRTADRWGISRAGLAKAAVVPVLPRFAMRALEATRPTRGPRWQSARWFAGHGVSPAPRWQSRDRSVMRAHQRHMMEDAHLPATLRYDDRNAMSLSLENRVPFLTLEVARFAFSLPEEYLVSESGETKVVLKAAMRGIVPDTILDRRDKIGFGVPVVRWLRELEPWVERRLPQVRACPALDAAAIDRQWNAVRSTGSVASAYVLWRCLTLATWAERGGITWD